jgi:HAD superfamily hydrolase (TIGR01509 family)
MSSFPPSEWSIQSVVFDLDGLFIDTEPVFAEAARRLLAKRGKLLNHAVLLQMLGVPARVALPLFREGNELTETVDELAAESRQLFAEVLDGKPAAILPGALELLESLESRKIPRAIATSSSSAYVKRVMGPHDILHRFDFVLTADDVVHGKPHPEIYLKAATRFGHAVDAMLVLEDSPNGMRAAKAAGARCVVVPHQLVDLREYTAADLVVPSLSALNGPSQTCGVDSAG